jgi:hypothetical protein
MNKLVETLKFGNVYRHSEGAIVLKVSTLKDICNSIIPLFKQYPIKGIKSKDFEDFCLIASKVQKKIHLTSSGLEEIRKINLGMNKGRKWK